MSWKEYDGSLPGYGYQAYGVSWFGGRVVWVTPSVTDVGWSNQSLNKSEWKTLGKSDVQWTTNTPIRIEWTKEG